MSQADFTRYLSVEVDTIEKPKPLPVGHFLATFKSWKGAHRDYDKATGGPKTPVIELTFTGLNACDDVEESDLPEKYTEKLVTKDYQLNDPNGMFALKKFTGETCDIDTKGLSLGDALDACKGATVKLFNDPRPDKKQEGVFYDNIIRVLKAD